MMTKTTRSVPLLSRPLVRGHSGETEHEHSQPDGLHITRRGTSRDAAALVRAIIATRGERPRTAHDIAAHAEDHDQLPDRVASLLHRHARAVQVRRASYAQWRDATLDQLLEPQRWIDQHLSRDHSREQGMDYGIDL